jgi:predicted DNA-binding ribbon-helix-helix protein
LVAAIDLERRHGNLSSAIRLYVLNHYRMHAGTGAEPSVARDMIGLQTPTLALRAE